MAQPEETPKIGAGHAGAMARMGLRELRACLYADSNVAQPAPYGLVGELTPGEVSAARSAEPSSPELDQEPEKGSILADRERQAEARDDHGRDDKDMDKG